ncbi:sensor histidine kinase [Nostoc sp. FACHB-152]|uniref:sensor histidine kinase n=1 Tax=unclassified Nostoc TaxID=2593658 RepID=UPI001681F24A|nr:MULTISPECIES: sensor histidine kinase [unclassified Nostoc]MBD2451908.1 sensor histidine kinase [Nostoc sp. FACHB-152]MBD2472474.1 sensor histidine kinase [Nostoc sp. FACHB-145]
MNLSFFIRPNPFRFLLYTEWVMLTSCASLAVIEALQQRSLPVEHILILTLLGLMGLRLPNGRTSVKVLYTAIEIILIFFGTVLGYLHILPTLYLIVVIRSCFLFESFGCLVIAFLCFILFLGHQGQYVQTVIKLIPQQQQQQFWLHQLVEILMFGLGLFFILQLVNILLVEQKTRQQLSIAHEQLQRYALQIEDLAAMQERNRIAREIHDSLGHALTALNVQIQTTARLWSVDPEAAASFLAQAQRLGEMAMQEVRQSVRALREDVSEDQPLENAIASLVEDFRQGTGLSPITKISLGVIVPLPIVKTLYRILQEALTNICKYAQATAVKIELVANNDSVKLRVEDNGKGFYFQQKMTGYGIRGMQERVAALKGYFHLESEPGNGCCITVELPLKTDDLSASVESEPGNIWETSRC